MKTIPLTQGKLALVDDEDFERLNQHKWFAFFHHGNWYAARNTYNPNKGSLMKDRIRLVRMHRDLMGFQISDGKQVDHIDGNGLNNQKANLRSCTTAENLRNCRARKGRKYKGVGWYQNAFCASISIGGRGNKKDHYLGRYATAEEAAEAYNKAAKKLFGSFARLNHIP